MLDLWRINLFLAFQNYQLLVQKRIELVFTQCLINSYAIQNPQQYRHMILYTMQRQTYFYVHKNAKVRAKFYLSGDIAHCLCD